MKHCQLTIQRGLFSGFSSSTKASPFTWKKSIAFSLSSSSESHNRSLSMELRVFTQMERLNANICIYLSSQPKSHLSVSSCLKRPPEQFWREAFVSLVPQDHLMQEQYGSPWLLSIPWDVARCKGVRAVPGQKLSLTGTVTDVYCGLSGAL